MITGKQRSFFSGSGLLAALLLTLALASPALAGEATLRIGFQKSSSLLILLKGQGILEKALAPHGVTVQWNEFTSGLPMVEALNVGALDLSADVADTVPLFAQAAGTEFTYFLQEKPSPRAEALVAPKDSPVKEVADLKGKKLAVAKASGAHYLTVAALKRAGLVFGKDVQIAYLQPADARTAFESGAIDAWTTWDPFLATVQLKSGARIIADGASSGVSYTRFYPVSSAYLKNNPAVLKVVADELARIGKWVKDNPEEAAKVHAPLVGLDIEVVKLANSRRSYAVALVDREALAEQQKIADLFVQEQLLPKKLDLGAVPVWNDK
ncbi:MAG: aliphatic sulfonate ABC transporter substrate-binding protein [Deltaproteobacteria bacterium]|jgi:sulfonate transport system substrate-binding protein|nr:aliphatic sulfonate ABC transporter substrate-binding protein [Deltaproteobacteria bacterium]